MKINLFVRFVLGAFFFAVASAQAAQITLQTYHGWWVTAEGGGGGLVSATGSSPGSWETFTLNDANGGTLEHGDMVTFQAPNGQYFCSENGGGSVLVANRDGAYGWEMFWIYRADGGTGTINSGDPIAIQGCNGQWVCAEDGGGQAIHVNRDNPAGWETFTLSMSGGGPDPTPSASIAPHVSSAVVGQSIQFTVSGNCAAGLNEIGLELCDGNGNPVANLGAIGTGATSTSYVFSWTPTSPGTYLFDGYAWNYNRSILTRTGVVSVVVSNNVSTTPSVSISPSASSIAVGQEMSFTVNASCEAGLNEIGLELCDGNGNPVANLGAIGTGATSAGYAFSWTPTSSGTFRFDAYAWNYNRSELVRTGVVNVTVNASAPTVGSITTSGSPTSNASFEVYANNVNNATRVVFPTWTDANGQDDLQWHEGVYDGANNRWKVTVNKSSHNSEIGDYSIHVYGIAADGSYHVFGAAHVTITPPAAPIADSVTNSGSPTSNASFEVYANNVRNVTNVLFPTWTDAGGQDDIIWYAGIYDGANNRWKININKSSHNNETGGYAIHVYGIGTDGTWAFLGATNVTLTTVQPPVSADYELTYEYNQRNQLTAIKNAAGATMASFGYAVDGRRNALGLGNGTQTTYGYDGAGRMDYLRHYRGNDNSTIQLQEYGYDLRDRRTWTQRDGNLGDTYTYQADSQLIDFKLNASNPRGTPSGWTQQLSYAYDQVGNRTVATDNGVTTTYTVDHANQYTSVTGASIQHGDGRGNITQWKDWSYTYDADNRMLNASKPGTTITFSYDPTGRLAKRTTNGQSEYFCYDGANQLVRVDQNGVLLSSTIWGPDADEVLMDSALPDGNRFFHADIQGTTVAVSNDNRDVVERYRYDPFGKVTFHDANWNQRSSSNYNIRFLFTGQEWMHAADLYNYKNRFYPPDLGRFFQSDPLRLGAMDLNLFRYCFNNPVNLSDPDGQAVPIVVVALVILALSPDYANAPAPGDPIYDAGAGNRSLALGAVFGPIVGKLFGLGKSGVGAVTARVAPREAGAAAETAVAPGKTALPDSYWINKKAPTQVTPGTRTVTDKKPSGRAKGEVYERTSHYDKFGRQTGQTHKTTHGEPAVHPNPHYHTRNPVTGQVSDPIPGVHPEY